MVAPPKPVRIPLTAAVDRYLDACRALIPSRTLQSSTVANYSADLHEFVRIVGADIITDDISGEDIDHAVTSYAMTSDRRRKADSPQANTHKSLGAQKRLRQSLSAFFAHCATAGWVQVSPMQWARIDPDPAKEALPTKRESLTGPQALAYITHGAGLGDVATAAAHEQNWARDRYLIALLLILGPRVSELTAANLEDLSPTEPEPGVELWQLRIIGKGHKPRTVPYNDYLVDCHRAYQQARPAPNPSLSPAAAEDARRALILTGSGRRLNPRDIQRMLDRAYTKVLTAAPSHAREVTPHGCRHTCATLMLAQGWDVKVVAQLLGHSNIATLSHYLDSIDGELARAVKHSALSNPGFSLTFSARSAKP